MNVVSEVENVGIVMIELRGSNNNNGWFSMVLFAHLKLTSIMNSILLCSKKESSSTGIGRKTKRNCSFSIYFENLYIICLKIDIYRLFCFLFCFSFSSTIISPSHHHPFKMNRVNYNTHHVYLSRYSTLFCRCTCVSCCM